MILQSQHVEIRLFTLRWDLFAVKEGVFNSCNQSLVAICYLTSYLSEETCEENKRVGVAYACGVPIDNINDTLALSFFFFDRGFLMASVHSLKQRMGK